MAQPSRRPRLAQKTKPCRFIAEISVADDFQRHRAAQINVERLVSDPHRTVTQLERFAVFARDQLVVLKSFRWLVQRRRDRLLERRFGLDPAAKTLAEHAHRTEFHCSRKLVTAARAGTLEVRAHGPNRPSDAIKASQRVWISSSVSP